MKKPSPASINIGDITGSTGVAVGEHAKVLITNNQIIININAPTDNQGLAQNLAEFTSLAEQIGKLTDALSKDIESQLDSLRQAILEGRRRYVVEWIKNLENDPRRWPYLLANVRAKILRLESGLILDLDGDIIQSKKLADSAKEISPTDDDSRLRALIARRESGPEKALSILDNQENTDSLNLKAIFLLELGRIKDCQDILGDFDRKNIEPNAETFRVSALYNLVTKEIHKAQLDIQKALELAPFWITNRFVQGVIYYFSALSPAILPDQLVSWPLPVDSDYLKTNDECLAMLDQAEQIFGDLANKSDITKSELRTFQVWHLTCLAMNSDKKDIAVSKCKALLQNDPTDFMVIVWAIFLSNEIDLGPSKKALRKLLRNQLALVPHIQALASIFIVEKNSLGVLHLLKQTKEIFHTSNADDIWRLLRIQAWAVEGNLRAAQNSLERDNFGPGEYQAKAIVFWMRAKHTKDWQPFIQFLEETNKATGDSTLLLDSCHYMGSIQNWEYIVERSENLINQISTSAVINLIAIALYNLDEQDRCLELLQEYQNWFRNRRLPRKLRRVKIYCSFNQGDWYGAVSELETLAQQEPDIENHLALFELYYKTGEYTGLRALAQKIIHYHLPSEILLQIARLLQLTDQQLSRDYLRKAIVEIPDALVGEALALGFQLGIEDEFEDIRSRFSQLGQQGIGGIRLTSLEEMIELLKQQREQEATLNEHYRSAKIPIHFLADRLRTPLAFLYHQVLSLNEQNPKPLQQLALLTRYGGRALAQDFPERIPEWRFHLDITALLLAQHLCILPLVESTFKPLFIPEEVIPALIQMQEQLKHSQPSRLQEFNWIKELVENGNLKVIKPERAPHDFDLSLPEELDQNWVTLFREALAADGYLVDFLPIRNRNNNLNSLIEIPQFVNDRLVNCRGVVDALRAQGPLSQDQYELVIKKLGNEATQHSIGVVPKQYSRLYFHANIPEVLAAAGVLSEVCDRFETFIEKHEFDQINIELERNEQAKELSGWISDLVSRINRGIKDGTYISVPTPKKHIKEREISSDELCTRCLITLLTYDTQERDVIWIEDRFLTSFSRRDTTPFISLDDTLKALVAARALDLKGYYDILIKARDANLRFITLQKDELIYHLKQAKIDGATIIPTKELIALRRYYAACLIQGEILHRPPRPPGSPVETGEVDFLLTFGHAITEAIAEIWSDESLNENHRVAFGEWVVSNLFLDHLGISNAIQWRRPNQDNTFLVAISLASFFAQGFNLKSGNRSKTMTIRKEYYEWIDNRILAPRFEANSELANLIGDYLKRAYSNILQEERDVLYTNVSKQLIQEFILDLPISLREVIEQDKDYMHLVGFNSITKLQDLSFNAKDFWLAVTEAINDRKGIVHIIDSDTQIVFDPVSKGMEYGFEFIHPLTGEKHIVQDDIFIVLLESPNDLDMLIDRIRKWLGGTTELSKEILEELFAIRDPHLRIERLDEWRRSSLIVFRSNIQHELEETQTVNFDHLMPQRSDGLLRYYRLDPQTSDSDGFENGLSTIAQAITQDEGLDAVLERFLRFPIALPDSLIMAISKLSKEDKENILEQVARNAKSPLSKIHCISLLLKLGGELLSSQQHAKQLVGELISDRGSLEIGAFLTVLRWTYAKFYNWQATQTWSYKTRLVLTWAHADWLFTTLITFGVPIKWIFKTFSQQTQRQILLEVLDINSISWSDVCHPRRNDPLRFLVSGLSYSLREYDLGFINEEIRSLVLEKIIPERNGARLPALTLLQLSDFSQNNLDSFLSLNYIDRIVDYVLPEYAPIFSPKSLYASLEQAISQLKEDPNNFSLWFQLHGILSELPPDVYLAERLKNLLSQLDISNLFKEDPGLGLWAMQIASSQLRNLKSEELRLHIKESLVEITSMLSESNLDVIHLFTTRGEINKNDDICALLFDTALYIAIASPTSSDMAQEFADIIFQITRAWPNTIEIAKLISQHLYEQLPIEEAQKLCPLLLRLRAEM